mmetsp:Transcript_6685/g.9844  ORF Transcript_6685/g.9844 Transcript_6685/m.9844 type:complete len:423 (-) Transcript_6685:36-1304(-)
MYQKAVPIASFFAFIFLSVQLITSSRTIQNVEYLISSKTPSRSSGLQLQREGRGQQQRIVILAGPHKTGTSSMQTNLWRWSLPTFNFTSTKYPAPLERNVIDWVWPVSPEIAELEMADTLVWDWTPAKVYYPLIEALRNSNRKTQPRSLFMRYSNADIVKLYRDLLRKYWERGDNIVFGTEAIDTIMRIPKHEGQALVKRLAKEVVPGRDSEVTVVVVYRIPKIKHLISVWHQHNTKPTDPEFYEWITTTENKLGPLDSLGMINIFLHHTNWNIALVDLEGLTGAGWDPSNFIACEVLDELCVDKKPLELHNAHIAPVIANVRSDKNVPNVPDVALEEIDRVLLGHDCKYIKTLEKWIETESETEIEATSRVELHYPKGIYEMMKQCKSMEEKYYSKNRSQMKKKIVAVAKKYGKIKTKLSP